MQLEPAETLQAEPETEPSDFWLGFLAGTFNAGFFVAVYAAGRAMEWWG